MVETVDTVEVEAVERVERACLVKCESLFHGG